MCEKREDEWGKCAVVGENVKTPGKKIFIPGFWGDMPNSTFYSQQHPFKVMLTGARSAKNPKAKC